ncbi:MAG: SDR family oxidoreductase, partial [Cyanobacteria bacterium J06607_6]
MLDLTGKRALVTGIANNRSIAWGIAQQLHAAGADLGVTYLPDAKGKMEKKVKDLVEPLNPSLFLPCNVQDEVQVTETFDAVKAQWGQLDILVHCLA